MFIQWSIKHWFPEVKKITSRIRIRKHCFLSCQYISLDPNRFSGWKSLTGHCLRVEDPAARTADQEQQPPAPRQVKLLHHAHRLRLKGRVSRDEYFF
jgi:hypothetical protein